MSEEEFINNIEGHITSLKNLDNKALKILVGKLEEENKNLKLIQETNEKQIQNDIKERDDLREENKNLKSDLEECECSMHFENDEVWYRKRECKKLNIKVASLEWEIKWLNSVIDKLKEENQTLELWLDNKEKLNEEYRKLIQKIDQLEEENENLRKDLFHLTNNGKTK